MKKTCITLYGILLGINAAAQIGMNTQIPKATLDITAKKGTTPDGLLVPRLTATEVQAMDTKVKGDQNSLLVYVTEPFTTPPTGKCINIDSEGYYYYDHKGEEGVWRKLGSTAYASGAGITIDNSIVAATGLESISKASYDSSNSLLPNPYHSWRLIGRDETKYEEPGYASVDLSFNYNSTKKTGATGNFSVAMGIGTTASADYSIAVGKYNIPDENNIFSVGIGEGPITHHHPPFPGDEDESLYVYTDQRNAFVIDGETGQVAINKYAADKSLSAQLQVNGLIQSDAINYYSNSSDEGRMVIADSDGVLKTSRNYFDYLKQLHNERFTQYPNIFKPGRSRITGTNGYWLKFGDNKWMYYGMVLIIGGLTGDDLNDISLEGYNRKSTGYMNGINNYPTDTSYIIRWDSTGSNNNSISGGGQATAAGLDDVYKMIHFRGSSTNVIGLVGFWGAYWDCLPMDVGCADYNSREGREGTKVLCIPIPQLYKYEE